MLKMTSTEDRQRTRMITPLRSHGGMTALQSLAGAKRTQNGQKNIVTPGG
jgi:hypothetical protein